MKPKGLAVMLLSKAKKDGEEGADDEEPYMPDGKEVAQDLIDAIEAKDAEGVWKAFRGLNACAEHGDEPEDDEPESDDQE